MTYRHFLFPLAPKQALDAAFHQALHVANLIQAKVTLLTVIEELAELADLSRYSVSTLSLLEHATHECQRQLDQHKQDLQAQYPDIEFQSQVVTGVPYVEIIKVASQLQVDMIVIDAHREHKETACQWGTSTRHLMRESEVPIWALHQQQEPPKLAHIVVSLDVSHLDNTALNEKLLCHAYEFAIINESRLSLCHAWELESEGYLRDWSRCSDLEIAVIAQQLRDDREDRLAQLMADYPHSRVPMQMIMLEGNAKTVLPDYINNHDVDLVIMGSLSRTGIAGFVMGNTAEYMLDNIQCSVITLKPDRFHSPLLGDDD
ncbi:universal stress protein [Photobacterium sp. TY1-4]|uniref:universal stress protein n=1 Tax=Photobacterium sp. TY1-4 TaxID=2899122 RepID=UPI0021C0EB23|nr:universal stress protein [Photobacterium sp. TY1-4]UXI03545.1 universal stress protein [Photobacterium sp. TY1-4]